MSDTVVLPLRLARRAAARDTGRALRVLGDSIRVRMSRHDTHGAFSLFEVTSPKGSEVPPHRHPGHDEAFHVLEGEAAMTLGGRLVYAGPGTTIRVPAGTVHAYRNEGPATLRMLVATTPSGLEEFFAEVDARASRGALDPADLAPLASAHGIEFVAAPPA